MDKKRRYRRKTEPAATFRRRLEQALYEGGMKTRYCYPTSLDIAKYALNSLHPMNGHTWRVVHAAPLEHPFSEEEVMHLSVPRVYRVELRIVD